MRLLVNGIALPISQMGPDFVLVDAPVNRPIGRFEALLLTRLVILNVKNPATPIQSVFQFHGRVHLQSSVTRLEYSVTADTSKS
jgi:hypothetical protein